MKVKGLEILRCDAGWRNYHFLKLSTDDGIVGWSEFDEGFGSPGVSAVIERLAGRVVGQDAFDHERIYMELYSFTRPAAGGVVAEGLGAIENALLDTKAKALGVPCYVLLGGKVRDRVRVYWSHCATWRINHPTLYQPAITSLDGVKAPKCARKVLPRSKPTSFSMRAGSHAAGGLVLACRSSLSSMSTSTCCATCGPISRPCARARDPLAPDPGPRQRLWHGPPDNRSVAPRYRGGQQ